MHFIFKYNILSVCIFLSSLLVLYACTEKFSKIEQKPIYGKVVKHGLLELIRGGGIIDDPKTSTGKAITKPVLKQINSNNRIAAKKDAYFAYQFYFNH